MISWALDMVLEFKYG
jgi:hypothetical protein